MSRNVIFIAIGFVALLGIASLYYVNFSDFAFSEPNCRDRKSVLIDQAHGQQFLFENESELDLSNFKETLEGEGLNLLVKNDVWDHDDLSEVASVVSLGPFNPYGRATGGALLDFINRGGRYVVALHVATQMADFLDELGVITSNGVVRDGSNAVDDVSTNFWVEDLEEHPLFDSISKFAVYGSWALLNERTNVQLLAKSSEKAWIDLDADNFPSATDAMQAFGIIATGEYGAGEFLVISDDAIFQNKFLISENQKLARNLSEWLQRACIAK